MFLNFIKDFYIKKSLKNSLHNVRTGKLSFPIKTVGLIVDESNFSEKQYLIDELIKSGILETNIKVILYKDKFKRRDINTYPTFGRKHLSWKSEIINPEVKAFIDQEFDLLINYYDFEKAILIFITHNSKAQFKVGFSSIDKRLNQLIINSNADNHKIFIDELFRYLKNLNKK